MAVAISEGKLSRFSTNDCAPLLSPFYSYLPGEFHPGSRRAASQSHDPPTVQFLALLSALRDSDWLPSALSVSASSHQ